MSLTLLIFAAFLLQQALPQSLQECKEKKSVFLSIEHNINDTGHPQLKARLEQRSGNDWKLDVELTTLSCTNEDPKKIFTFILNGHRTRPPPNYKMVPELGHFRQPEKPVTWEAARDQCAAEGAALFFPASASEVETAMRSFGLNATDVTRSGLVWLGASDLEVEGKFITVNGIAIMDAGYNKWTPNQPAGKLSENCLGIWVNTLLLEDVPCSWKLPYLCKISF